MFYLYVVSLFSLQFFLATTALQNESNVQLLKVEASPHDEFGPDLKNVHLAKRGYEEFGPDLKNVHLAKRGYEEFGTDLKNVHLAKRGYEVPDSNTLDESKVPDSNTLDESKELYLNNREFLNEHRTNVFSRFANQIRDSIDNIYKTNKINSIVGDLVGARSLKNSEKLSNKSDQVIRLKRNIFDDIGNLFIDAAEWVGNTVIDVVETAIAPGIMIANAASSLSVMVADYAGFVDFGTPLYSATSSLLVNAWTADLCYGIEYMYSTSCECGRNLYYLSTALQHSNYLATNILSTFTSLEIGQLMIEKRLIGINEKLDKKIGEVNDKLTEMKKQNEENFALVQNAIQKGFKEMSVQSRMQYESIMKQMNGGFNTMEKLINDGVTKVVNRIDNMEKNMDYAQIDTLHTSYLLNFRKDIDILMKPYESYVRHSTSNSSRERFVKICSYKRPSGLSKTLSGLFTEDKMSMLLEKSNGHLSKIKALLTAVAYDAGSLVSIAPACNAFLYENACQANFETINQMTSLVNVIIKFIQDYDAHEDTQTSLLKSFKKIIVEISKQNAFGFPLTYEKRKGFAYEILSSLRKANPDLHFTVIVENPVQDSGDDYISHNANEKLFIFKSEHFENLYVPNIKLFWHRTEHQPVGRMWQICYDEVTNCWHDEKPHCMTIGTTTVNPWYGKPVTKKSDNMCFSEPNCRIEQFGMVPECTKKPCFTKCSAINVDIRLTSPQKCYNEKIPCVYKNPNCVQIGVNNYDAFFPNSSLHITINGEKCQKVPSNQKDIELDKFRYIGGYQTTSCVTNLQKEVVKFDNVQKSAKIEFAIVKATNYDCTTIFSFPQPGNIMKYVNSKEHSKVNFLYKNWEFDQLSHVGEYIEKHHEMKDLGYCLLGISRSWVRGSDDRPALETSMRGVSEHYWWSNSELMNFSTTHSTNKIEHAHIIYIVYNCCTGKLKKPSDSVLKNYLEDCNNKTSNTITLTNEMKKEHASFLLEVNGKQKAIEKQNTEKENKKRLKKNGIIAGSVVACIALLGIVGGTFFVLSRKQRNRTKHVQCFQEGKLDRGLGLNKSPFDVQKKENKPDRMTQSNYYSIKDEQLIKKRSNAASHKSSRKNLGKEQPLNSFTKIAKTSSVHCGEKIEQNPIKHKSLAKTAL